MSEEALLACLAKHPELLSSFSLPVEAFERKLHRDIFSAISDGDLSQVYNEKNAGEVLEVLDWPFAEKNLQLYVDGIRRRHDQRELRFLAEEFARRADAGEDCRSWLLDQLRETGDSSDIRTFRAFAKDLVDYVDAVQSGDGPKTIPTKLEQVDQVIDGLTQEDHIVLAARTSVGKTAMALNLALNAEAPVGIISGEQSGRAIVGRMMGRVANVNPHNLKTGNVSSDEAQRLVQAYSENDLPIYIVDDPRPSIDMIERNARIMSYKYSIQALFVDYLQLITNTSYDEKRLQVADTSMRLKALARELRIPVVTLAQLNRNADGRDPRLSDLKESGSIEEDADIVILLVKDPSQPKRLKWDIAKNRDGQTGSVYCNWQAERMRAY